MPNSHWPGWSRVHMYREDKRFRYYRRSNLGGTDVPWHNSWSIPPWTKIFWLLLWLILNKCSCYIDWEGAGWVREIKYPPPRLWNWLVHPLPHGVSCYPPYSLYRHKIFSVPAVVSIVTNYIALQMYLVKHTVLIIYGINIKIGTDVYYTTYPPHSVHEPNLQIWLKIFSYKNL